MQSKEGFHEFIAVSGFLFSFLLNEGTLFLKCYNTCSIAVLKYSRLIPAGTLGHRRVKHHVEQSQAW